MSEAFGLSEEQCRAAAITALEKLPAALAERLPQILDREARIVTESHKRTPLELPFPLLRERTYGDTRIAVHRAG